ncbi:carbonyl reductase [Phaeosphaeria sp. MPI-PUGE-AT-0046c]|nr:carbonyl reductase [Phaeosphaeria sp. MPI-PUGE-AT-0046c]
MSNFTRVGVVTGANKGIGYAIVRQLALQYPSSPLNNGPLLICEDGGLATIKFRPFDVTNKSTITDLSTHLKKNHPEGIDFFINNAGIALDGFNPDIVKRTFETNYYATLAATSTFLADLTSSGRLVNLASSAGTLGRYSPAVRKRFLDAATSGKLEDVDAIMSDFAAAVEMGKEKEEGFPSAAYAVSKAGLIAGGKVLGREHAGKEAGKELYSVDPGYVNTDMSKGNGTRTPDQGADTSVKLALKVIGGGGQGEFWRDGREVEW